MDGLPVTTELPSDSEGNVIIPDTPVQAVTEELGEVASDTAKLLELQVQLFQSECLKNVQRLAQPIGVSLAGIACGTASLIVIFHAMGWALHDLFGLSVSLSLFLVSLIGITITAVALWTAWAQFKQPRISFEKSKAELMRNFKLYANLLSGSGR